MKMFMSNLLGILAGAVIVDFANCADNAGDGDGIAEKKTIK